MSLSNDLIQQFVKANKDETDKKTESTSYGTIVISEGKTYVQLDGSTIYTPVSSTIVVKNGDRVMVTNKDRSLIVTGNLTDPSAAQGNLDELGESVNTRIDEFDIILADKVNTDQLNAVNANIQNLQATNVTISGKLEAAEGKIDNLETDNLKVNGTLEAHSGKFDTIDATFVNISGELNAHAGKFDELEATNADFRNLEADYGEFKNLTADNFTAVNGTIESLDTTYATIDFANIDEAAVRKIFSDSGIIKDLVVSDGRITGELVGVTIKGDLIEGNTIKAEKLVVKGSDGIYYKLNVEGGATTSAEVTEEDLQNGLSGSIIVAKSITAEKVAVDDLVAFGATIGGFEIESDKIHSVVKNSVDNTTPGIYMDNSGQVAFGDGKNYLRYFKDADGKYRLEIAAASLSFSASDGGSQSLEEVINNATNIQVGARNLIRNSENLVFDNYGFEEAYLNVSHDNAGNVIVDSNAVASSGDRSGNANLDTSILTPYADSNGNATLYSEYDPDEYVEANMRTLTVGGYKFNIVSGASEDAINETIGTLDELYTEDKSSIVAAINEVYMRGGGGTGGGGGAITYIVTLINLSDSRVITVPEGTTVKVKMNYSSVDGDGMDDGAGIGKLLIGGIIRKTFSVDQGDFEVDITSFLTTGTNNISIKVTNSENVTKTMTYTVTLASVSLTSSFNDSVPYTGAFSFPYIPTGLATKTVYFEVDGEEIGTATVTTSGRQVSYTIPAQSHGAHILRVWFTCEVEGTVIESNVLYYSVICTTPGNNTPIIAVTTPPTNTVEQYTNIVKKYRVYNPNSLTAAVSLEVNGAVISNLTVDRTEQTWSYQAINIGELIQTIRCGDEYVSWTQTVTESSIDVEAETEALALYLTSYGKSNNSDDRDNWESNGIVAEFSNFNFVSDGWVMDDDNITVLRVTGDARLTIPYKIFAASPRTTGKTLEFELATREVLNYDAEVINCYSGNRGFIITAQQLTMASQQSVLGTRYKEDEHIRVSIVVEKRTENRLMLCYINGILSGAVQYPDDDQFVQGVPVDITIGSDNCTLDLYNIRIYDNSLTRHQILDNWIADTQVTDDKIARYNRNEVYDEYGQVVISKLPSDLPYMVLQGSELPQFKGDKKTINGYFTDPMHPERSFSIVDAQIDVQGTSSQYYYVKNYKIKYKNGFILYDGTKVDNYQLNENAVPTSEFTMKADVASSEGAFNVVLAMLYNDLCPYKTPAQENDPRVRQCIEGFPIVMFWDNGTETKFIGKYNFNNDKGTAEVFGFKSGDESWEILQNGTDRVGWHSADFSDDGWKTDFEARYPEDNVNTTRLKSLAEWLMSTDTDQATGRSIAPVTYGGVEYTADTVDYRLAKFSAELSNYFIEEAVIFYYLFTEIFLSIDQREKNAFPTYLADEGKWIILFYDADSSCGTDNKGNLTFDYYLEDIDYTESGDPVYNGQNSVLWKNIRETRHAEIAAMYKDLRTRSNNSIGYESVIGAFNNHQSKWPEAIFNEDMYRKCLEPLITKGDGIYLPMLQGKKEMWMKWWLYNRFRYLDSKYETGTSMSDRITIRIHAKQNISLTSYVNMYGRVYYNAEMVEHRMQRGQPYEFVWSASGAEDAVVGINDADMLTSLGDLSPHMVELVDIHLATHLASLKVGDSAANYENRTLKTITLGNNILLRTLDASNCVNLTTGPNLSGCTNIEEIYLNGTSITGLTLPNGGILKTLVLPATVTNLTVRNHKKLTRFVHPDYSAITSLWLENNSNAIDPFAIIGAMPENGNVRIIGFNKTTDNNNLFAFISKLDSMRGLDENSDPVDRAQVSGTIYVDKISAADYAKIVEAQTRYPDLVVIYNELVPYMVRFYNYDGTFLQAVTVPIHGGSAIYTGITPVKPNVASYEDWVFIGWSPEPTNVTSDMDCIAQFKNKITTSRLHMMGNLYGDYRNDTTENIGDHGFACSSVTTATFTKVTTITSQAFYGSASLTKVDFHQLSSITNDIEVFSNCSKIEAVIFRSNSVVSINRGYSYISFLRPEKAYIYVPLALISAYKNHSIWSAYANRFRAIEDYPDICGGE